MSGTERGKPALNAFSFEPNDLFQVIIDPADVEIGLEIASLEERHYLTSAIKDETCELAERIERLRKYAEARAELQAGMGEATEDERNFAVDRFATRMLRAGFVAAQRRAERETGGAA